MPAPDSHPPFAPVLETERLLLRGHGLEDFPETAALWADPAVTRYIGGRPLTGEEVWARLLRHVGHWAALGFGNWVVQEKATGRFVGEVGMFDYRRDITPSLAGAPELGWAISPWTHGRGFATEAVRAALAWGETRFGPARMMCMIHPDNVPSLRVAEKCGFREYARTLYKGEPTILFERPGVPPGAPRG